MEFRILGHLEAAGPGETAGLGGGKQRAVLAVLLLQAGRVVPVERLLADLWGEELPETATKMVQIHVSQLRKALPDGTILTRAPGYQLCLDGHELDLHRFERLCADGRAAFAAGDAPTAAALLADALSLWRGPALAEFSEPFAAVEAARLEELRLGCQEDRIEADLALGRHGQLVAELEALAAAHPLRERPLRQLVLALYRCGRHADALAAYQAFRRRLDEELGIDPSAGLRELERAILRQDAALDPPAVGRPGVTHAAARPRSVATGRGRELGRLDQALDAALAGRRQLVLVAGEAGIGKTTLVDAFTGSVAASGAAVVARGQCVEHRGVGEAYMPLLEALGRLCRQPGGDEAVAVLAERAPAWLLQMPWLVSDAQLELLQRRAVGTSSDRMLRELLEGLEALAERRPIVLALEDLHWSDVSTVDVLDAIFRRDEPARILVIGTYRPGDATAAGHPVRQVARDLRARGRCTELAVGALPAEGVAALVSARFDVAEPPAELVPLLQARTRGSPLFVERLLDAWLEAGHLALADGRLELTTGREDLVATIPDTVVELIEQLLERLAPGDRGLLEAASVVGTTFSAAAVAAACERDTEEVEERCDALARQGACIERLDSEEWPDLTVAARYGFVHDLHREVLYAGIPAGRRTRLHARVGDRLERAHGERAGEIAAALAFHFVHGREPLRAARHLAAAASGAMRMTAAREAVTHLRTAQAMLAAATAGPERDAVELDVLLRLGPALVAVDGWSSPEAEQALVAAQRLAATLGRDGERVRAGYQLGTMYEVRGEYARAEGLMHEALASRLGPLPPSPRIDCHELLACSLFHQGDFATALVEAENGIAVTDGGLGGLDHASFGETPGIACHTWAGLSLWFLGAPDRALARATRAVELAEPPSHRHSLATAQAHRAMVHQCRLELEEALAAAASARELALERGFAYRAAMAGILRGWARVALGEPDGVGEIQEGIAVSRSMGARMDDGYYLGLLADALVRLERWEHALAAIDEARAAVAGRGRFFYEAELLRLRARALDAQGDAEGAAATLEHAVEIARAQGARSLELRAGVDVLRLDPTRTEVEQRVRALLDEIEGGAGTADLAAARTLVAGRVS